MRRSATADETLASASVWMCSTPSMRKRMRSDFVLRLEMDVGSAQTHGFLEHRLQQLDDRRVLGARVEAEQVAELDRHVAEFGRQFLGQAGNLLATVIDAVDHGQQLAFGNDGEVDLTFDQTGDFVIGLQGRSDRPSRFANVRLATAREPLPENAGPALPVTV